VRATELLYLYDSYLTTATARVIAVDNHNVVLDRTVFYPRGGGQMADRGYLRSDGNRCSIIAVEKRGDAVFHTLDGAIPDVGSLVECQIDWEYRYQMMRTHTALHVLCGVIYHQYGATVTGCQMYPDKARMDFALGDLSKERLGTIDRLSNETIMAGFPVRTSWIPRERASSMTELVRTKINLVPPQIDPIRTVEIVGLDLQADGGTHVANTLEIGSLRIVRAENKGRDNRRIQIELSPPVVK